MFLRGREIGHELVRLRGVGAVEVRRREESLDARDLGFGFVDLRLDAFEFALLLEAQLAGLGGLGSRVS